LPTGKILHSLRSWFPRAALAGWKYELDGQRPDAIAQAIRQIQESHTDACVANGRAYGEGFGWVTADGACTHARTRESLFEILEEFGRKLAVTRR
jgi:hypothetical protein